MRLRIARRVGRAIRAGLDLSMPSRERVGCERSPDTGRGCMLLVPSCESGEGEAPRTCDSETSDPAIMFLTVFCPTILR